jgi:hypothetical protein
MIHAMIKEMHWWQKVLIVSAVVATLKHSDGIKI